MSSRYGRRRASAGLQGSRQFDGPLALSLFPWIPHPHDLLLCHILFNHANLFNTFRKVIIMGGIQEPHRAGGEEKYHTKNKPSCTEASIPHALGYPFGQGGGAHGSRVGARSVLFPQFCNLRLNEGKNE